MDDQLPPGELPSAAEALPPHWLLYVRLLGVLVIGAVIVAAIVLLRQDRTHSQPTRAAQAVGATPHNSGPLGALERRAPVVGQSAPNFALLDTDGRRVELAALKGKAVVVNFWATWCGPCREEFPELQKAASSMSDDVVILGLDQAESAEKVTQFRDQFGATFTLLLDSDNAVADTYRLRGIPDTIFVDRNGVVRDVAFGPLSAGSFRYKIKQALEAK